MQGPQVFAQWRMLSRIRYARSCIVLVMCFDVGVRCPGRNVDVWVVTVAQEATLVQDFLLQYKCRAGVSRAGVRVRGAGGAWRLALTLRRP